MSINYGPTVSNILKSTFKIPGQTLFRQLHKDTLPDLIVFAPTQSNFIIYGSKCIGGKPVHILSSNWNGRMLRRRTFDSEVKEKARN